MAFNIEISDVSIWRNSLHCNYTNHKYIQANRMNMSRDWISICLKKQVFTQKKSRGVKLVAFP
ncbi:hypothetical protein TW74_01955 [Vibrio nigripulchritudo]|nr:hypothetical protein TW74_01955 [Vibrio nigripulchritudo]